MSMSRLNSLSQNVETMRWNGNSGSGLVACRVCDRVFFDNVSLVLHFEGHLKDGVSSPRQHGKTLPAPCLKAGAQFCHSSPAGDRTTKDCFGPPCPLPVPAPMNSSLRGGWTSLQPNLQYFPNMGHFARNPIRYPTAAQFQVTSQSSDPLVYSPWNGKGPGAMRAVKREEEWYGDVKDLHTEQFKFNNPIPEIIVVSDDEDDEDDKNNQNEIDLTLRL